MAESTLRVKVNQGILRSDTEEVSSDWKGSQRGEGCVLDFYTAMVLEQRGFQVRAGSVSTPVVGDVVITDQVCEMAAEAPTGLTLMPIFFNFGLNLAAATLFEVALKSRPWTTAITFTTAFTPLPLYIGGVGALSRAFVDAAGGVDVGVNEDLTLDRLHYHWAQPIAAGAYTTTATWEPIAPPCLNARAILYVQIGADTTGPSYFATINYFELPTASLS
mgnify:CR=1 FL=1